MIANMKSKPESIKQKKALCIELAKSSCLANRPRIWQLIQEIGDKEILKDKDFTDSLILISMEQIRQLVNGERLY